MLDQNEKYNISTHVNTHRLDQLTWHDGLIPEIEISIKIGETREEQPLRLLFNSAMLDDQTQSKTLAVFEASHHSR